jgi:Fe-S cluster biogenesis protein NfuA
LAFGIWPIANSQQLIAKNMNKQEIEQKVLDAIETIRPHLQADGGDIELVDITEDDRVLVKFIGACSDCSMSGMTLKAGVEHAIKTALPHIKTVEALSEDF